jgi:hypothetical protein
MVSSWNLTDMMNWEKGGDGIGIQDSGATYGKEKAVNGETRR